MKVLMIGGDKNFITPGTEAYKRYELQKSAVDQLDAFVWPRVHSAWHIYRVARKNHYEVITAQDPFWRGLLGWKVARLTGAKLNIQVHADLEGQSFIKHILAQIILRHADSVRVVSGKLKQQVERMGARNVNVLPIFIDTTSFRSIQPRPHEQKTILWVGRFEAEKDPLLAIEIFRAVRVSIDAKLIMLGKGTLESDLHTHVTKLPVEFPGWQDPVLYLETADVVLSTSKHESWGASIVEALAAGVPVVAPDIGIAKEAGAIVVPRNELADAVIKVLKEGSRGELKISLLDKEEWVKRWCETLV